jgi:hypothetical protein
MFIQTVFAIASGVAQLSVQPAPGVPTELSLEILSASGSEITVEIFNNSGKEVRLLSETNSWGADRWRVVDVGIGGSKSFFQETPAAYSRNVPEFFSIPAGGKWERTLTMTGKEWSSSKNDSWSPKHGDTILVEYDIPWTTVEPNVNNVWHGFLVAAKKVK